MNGCTQHFLSPKLMGTINKKSNMYTVVAREFIPAGQLLCMWGGDIVTYDQFLQKSPAQQMHSIQVEDDLFQISYRDGEEPHDADYFNHSCSPNAGLSSPISLVAICDIQAGEEVCFDYAMSDSVDYDEFQCSCGSTNCRRWVRGTDWMRSDLQKRYEGYFSPYLARRIQLLPAEDLEMDYENIS